ncbi:homocysteine S-methyltransferase [Ephemerocybe angulata]|uniref:Homocysteine S-methyltransferase n=1 Tax=Ephemerocybe angulata TaxID=980116 RepID=A0A8H6MCV7_9AGAR|nr:homocysteine S-methyltransferase [Tulosesus angulatus]
MTTKVTILDGGLGTALEHELGTDVSESPLWSTRAVINSDQTIVNAHRLFIRAGAKIIETATYQASVPNLVVAGLSLNDAKETMHKAVKLAQRAKALYPETSGSVRIALSLGPFGATLRPTQEFLGYYPPPYGPKAFSELGPNTRSFSNPEEEQEAINALAIDPATWNSIDYIAFETVLLKREVKSIRRAISLLSEHLAQTGESLPFSKPWWISFVCPDEARSEKLPVPSGIGINCTSLERLPSLIADLTRTIPRVVSSSMSLVLYPNGGEYDTSQSILGTEERWRYWKMGVKVC